MYNTYIEKNFILVVLLWTRVIKKGSNIQIDNLTAIYPIIK